MALDWKACATRVVSRLSARQRTRLLILDDGCAGGPCHRPSDMGRQVA
jgi:hypothetical protein